MRVMILMLLFALIGVPAQVSADIDDGLIAWYPFDNGVVDKTGNIEALEGESILPILKGKFGGAVKLDGDTFIAIPVDLGPDLIPSVTISLWVKTDPRPTDAELEKSLPSTIYVVSESIAVGNLKNDSTYFYGEALNHSIVGPKHTARRGQWQHVALVRTIEDRPNAKGEIEPHVVAQFHSGGRMSELVMPFRGQGMATDLYLGTNSPRYPSSFRFRGAVDELRIYDRALSQEEVGLLAKASSSQTSTSASNDENTEFPNNAGTTDTSPLDNVSSGGQSIGDMAIDNPTDSATDSNGEAPTYGGLPSGNPFSLPESQADDLSGRIDDPDIEGRQYVADWRLVGMVPLTAEQLASGIYPGSELTIKIRLKKDDVENKIPDIRLELDPLSGRPKEFVSVSEVTSESSPTAQRDVSITLAVPDDISFGADAGTTSWRPVVTVLNRNGLQLHDSDPGNHQRELSIQVSRPLSTSNCGGTVQSSSGERVTTDCLSDDSSSATARVYIDHSVLVFAEPTIVEGHEGDVVADLILEDGSFVQVLAFWEMNDKPCKARIASKTTSARRMSDHCASPTFTLSGDNFMGIDLWGDDEVIVGLRVCRNRAGNRLKGIGVYYRTLNNDGSFLSSTEYKEAFQDTCASSRWTEPVYCQVGAAAAGIRLLISDGTMLAPNKYFHSVALACGAIKVREEA